MIANRSCKKTAEVQLFIKRCSFEKTSNAANPRLTFEKLNSVMVFLVLALINKLRKQSSLFKSHSRIRVEEIS